MEHIFLISGKAECGKTTFANALKEELEHEGKRVCVARFANSLKHILKDYYGWDGITKDEKNRSLLQRLGTEVVRVKMNRPLFHAQRLCEEIEIVYDDFDYVIVDDLRFENEAIFPKAYFPNIVSTIRIIRPNHVSKLTPEQMSHPSEIGLNDFKGFDHELIIESGLENIKTHAKKLVRFEYE